MATTLAGTSSRLEAPYSGYLQYEKGCAGLFSSKGWNGSSFGLVKPCFWAFARMGEFPPDGYPSELNSTKSHSDLWAAFLLGRKTLLPTASWVNDDNLEAAAAQSCPDDYCNLCALTFARLVDRLVCDGPAFASLPEHSPQQLWDEFQQWWRLRPKRVKPLVKSSATICSAFPTIVFIESSSGKHR